MDIRYVRSEGVGRYPRRPKAKKHRLTEREILYIDKLFQSKMLSDIVFPPVKVNYNKPGNRQALERLRPVSKKQLKT